MSQQAQSKIFPIMLFEVLPEAYVAQDIGQERVKIAVVSVIGRGNIPGAPLSEQLETDFL